MVAVPRLGGSLALPVFTDPMPKRLILGTAGHVDHGKTSLVRRLTGIDTEKPEERARGMTIDLGFAHLDLAGARIGVVDVPGHEAFVRNMVAGAAGIDAALLVVAADDGVMPQTLEHIDILRLLGVSSGLIVLTKIDLIPPGRADDAERAVREALSAAGSPLRDAPAVRVSNATGEGFDRLTAELARLVETAPGRPRGDVFRLPVDRAFTVAGRGTVVTGSSLGGTVAVGAEAELLPAGRRVRVRGLQSHHEDLSASEPGRRTAVNLVGVKAEEIARGDELAAVGYLTPSPVMEVSLRLLPSAPRPLTGRMRVRVTLATREVVAVVLLPAAVPPGGESFAQLRLAEPAVATHGQPFILRDETAQRTLGGGVVLRPVGLRRWKPTEPELAALRTLATGSPRERVAQVFRDSGQDPPTELQIAARAGLDRSAVDGCLAELLKAGALVKPTAGRLIVAPETLAEVERTVAAYVAHFHARHPDKLGIARRELVSALEPRVRKALLEAVVPAMLSAGKLFAQGDVLMAAGREPPLSEADRKLKDALEAEFRAAGFSPPEPPAARAAAGADAKRVKAMIDLLTAQGRLAFIAPGLFLHAESLSRLKTLVADAVRSRGPLAVMDIRDLTGTSRKYAVPLCEHLDKIGFTARVGDLRTLKG